MRKGFPVVLWAAVLFLAAFTKPYAAEQRCDAVLSAMGLARAGAYTKEEIILPSAPDSAWEAYLREQTANGFPLRAFGGQAVWHLSCPVQNHPEATYANFYWKDGKLLGGDILSPQLNGFLEALPPQN